MSLKEIIQRIESAKSGTNPALVCRVPSGWVFFSNMQFLIGYCILQSDPVVESLNSLDQQGRMQFLLDMAIIGDALLESTNAYRINYAIMGNSEPVLHAHIVPRYLSEPAELRKGLPWSYAIEDQESASFNFQNHMALMKKISAAIQKRL